MPSRGRTRLLALAAVALVAVVLAQGCVVVGSEPLIIAASAPKSATGMTLFLVTEANFLEKYRELNAEYLIYFGDKLVYPQGGKGGTFDLDGRTGLAFVPYDRFVVGNGEYDVLVKYAGKETRTRVPVQKWVDYVYVHPFDKGDHVMVQAALSSATGGNPEDRILTQGELVLTIVYHGPDMTEERPIGQVSAYTRDTDVSTTIDVPRTRFTEGPGYYSFEPLFHNLEARDNLQVGPDPTMANQAPPWNWILVSK